MLALLFFEIAKYGSHGFLRVSIFLFVCVMKNFTGHRSKFNHCASCIFAEKGGFNQQISLAEKALILG